MHSGVFAGESVLKTFAAFVPGIAAALILSPALAGDYPSRPITIIVSHRTGGPADVIARVLGKMLTQVVHQPVVVENRPGASGTIAAEQAAHAAADGYTLLMGNTAILATVPARPKHAGFDPQLDFMPITLIGTQANALVVHPSVPALSLAELIAHAKANPRLLTFGSSGHGSAAHLAAELFKSEAKVSLVHVPYQKPAFALRDVVAGHVHMMFAPAALVVNHVRAGRLRALGIAALTRSAALPGVATMDELGLPKFDATTWYGLVAPAGTSKEIIDVLYHSAAAVLTDPEARQIMAGLGIDVVGNSPREFEAYIRAQIPKWSTVVKSMAHVFGPE
jgi:tripartite-type tricarboxylate transporter receptor subunit TctC